LEDLGRRVPGHLAERAHRPHAADADQDLLADAVVLVAAVEPVGDAAQVRVVLLDVGVEQQQRHAPDRRAPDPGVQHAPARHVHLDQHRGAGLVGEQVQRQSLGIEHRVGLELPPVQRERLAEVAGAVEQADGDQRDAEVRRGLEVVAREHAEAAGVVREHLRDAELHREVPDGGRQARVVVARVLVPARFTQVVLEVVGQLTDGHDGLGVRGQLGEPRRGDLPQHAHRVVPAALPRLGVERGEQVLRGRMPAPPQVHRQGLQRLERGGQLGADGETTESSHGPQRTGTGQVIDKESHRHGGALTRPCSPSGLPREDHVIVARPAGTRFECRSPRVGTVSWNTTTLGVRR
jgi:hypothetical protein